MNELPPMPPIPAPRDGETYWLAMLLRQGLLLIVRGIERRYDLSDKRDTLMTIK